MRNGYQLSEAGSASSIPLASTSNMGDLVLDACDPAKVVLGEATTANVIVIEKRTLLRECLTRCFAAALGPAIVSFASVEDWLSVMDRGSAGVIVLSIEGSSRNAESVQREINLITRAAKQLPIILLADEEEPGQVAEALERGLRGYIPTSVSLPIAIEAMRLVRVGGTYIPPTCLISASRKDTCARNGTQTGGTFTLRQAAVLDALCTGKPNKIIAYELNMCESTVKVHVRNIMKKLKAKNRTEVAYMARGHEWAKL